MNRATHRNTPVTRFQPILLLVMMLAYTPAVAQIDPLYSQYLNNPYLINPAYTGMNQYLNVMAGFRKQWAGFEGSPVTMSLTTHTSLFNNKMGTGIIISQDQIGETRNTLVQGTYAYKIKLPNDHTFSFGLQAGMMNFRSDNAQLNPLDAGDPLFVSRQNTSKPTFGAGILFKSDRLFVGASIPRLLKAIQEYDDTESELYTQHFYGFASYVFLISPRVRFKPAVLVRGVSGSPVSTDLNFQFNVDERYAFGGLTRNFKTYGFLVQLKMTRYRFGYVFELPTNKSVGVNFTTHDFTVGINLSLFDFHDILEVSDF